MRAAFLVLAACAVVLAGCPKEKRALNAARKAVEVAASTVDLVDAEVSTMYTAAATECLESSDDRPAYETCVRRWNKTVLAVVSMKNSLLLVENSLDAWEAGSPNGRNNLLSAVACFSESLLRLQDILSDLGANTPALDQGLDYVDNLFGHSGFACPIGT